MHVYPNYYKIIFTFFLTDYKNEWNSINFNDKKIKKSDFYKNKEIFDINDIDVNKRLVSKKKNMVNIITLYWV